MNKQTKKPVKMVEQGEYDKAGGNVVEECAWVLGQLKSVLTTKEFWSALGYSELGSALDYQDTLISLKLS